jgi:hypothetical protein
MTGAMTAIGRKKPSAPMAYLFKREFFDGRVLDYGCGKDRTWTNRWDPNHQPVRPGGLFDRVVCNYVLNVIPEEDEAVVIEDALSYLDRDGAAAFAVRRDLPREGRQGRGCWQRYVELETGLTCIDLRLWRVQVVEKKGRFAVYVFRTPGAPTPLK